eukprot:6670695-Heterocapsa_arctica.AAC.1
MAFALRRLTTTGGTNHEAITLLQTYHHPHAWGHTGALGPLYVFPSGRRSPISRKPICRHCDGIGGNFENLGIFYSLHDSKEAQTPWIPLGITIACRAG